jgi:uncharacterized damage-inducible protein DinB
MDKNYFALLYDYNYWANARVLAAAGRITPAEYIAPAGLSHGSLRATFVHTLNAEIIWRKRTQEGISPNSQLSEADYPTLEFLVDHWRSEEQAMRGYIDSLSNDDLDTVIRYQSTQGIPFENTLWKILAHVVNHGTQSRAEAGIALLAFGQSPGDLDMILYFRQQNG